MDDRDGGGDIEWVSEVRTGRSWRDLPPHPPVGVPVETPPQRDPVDVDTETITGLPSNRRPLAIAAIILLIFSGAAALFIFASDDGEAASENAASETPNDNPRTDPTPLPAPDEPQGADPIPSPAQPEPETPEGTGSEPGGQESAPSPVDPTAPAPAPVDLPEISIGDLPAGYVVTGSYQSIESTAGELAVVAGRRISGPHGEVSVTARRPVEIGLTGENVTIGGHEGTLTSGDGAVRFTWEQDGLSLAVTAPEEIAETDFERIVESVEATP